jgi:para-nitrobenzyl esterase
MEIPYVFGNLASTPPLWPAVPETPGEMRLSDAMANYWAAFARDGAPSASGEADWRPYSEGRAYMAFEDAPRLRAHVLPGMYELNEEIVCRRRAAGGVSWNWNFGIVSPPLPADAPSC